MTLSTYDVDVCIYGGTSSGIMAAIAASREGCTVLIVEPSRWLGGMTGGGISHLDWGRAEAVGGTTRSFLTEGLPEDSSGHPGDGTSLYSQTTRVGLGNRAYRERFQQRVKENGIDVLYEHRLNRVEREENRISTLSLDYAPVDATGCPSPLPHTPHAVSITAKVFVDGSYEGDLMAKSGVSYTWGRESTDQYGESLAGVRPNLWVYDIDPYIEPGNPASGTIPFVKQQEQGPIGSADRLTMGYGFRYMWNREGTGIPVPDPESYDPAEFELYRRALQNGVDIFTQKSMKEPGVLSTVAAGPLRPNLSRSLWSQTVAGFTETYPDGDWAERSRVWKLHRDFLIKLIYFARTDPSVPEDLRKTYERASFVSGEFDDTDGWPHQLYVREARRMVSEYRLTQQNLAGDTCPVHSVGLASYGIDDWPYATIIHDGKVALQGGEFSILYIDGGKTNGITSIPYEAIVPKRSECENLLVPVCLSASHVAMTAIRMEPVWMILGESAGVAASMAASANIPVQDVVYVDLKARLEALGQVLSL